MNPLIEMPPEMAGTIIFAIRKAADTHRALGAEGPNSLDHALAEFEAAWDARTHQFDGLRVAA